MKFRRIFSKKLAIVFQPVIMVVLMIALVALPADAVNEASSQPVVIHAYDGPPTVSIPMMINYQGYLTDSNGNPITDTLEMTFSIYEAASGGSPIWTEIQSTVVVTGGLFNVLLGNINPINWAPLNGESYLGLRVGSDTEMVPRQRIASVAYAHNSAVANFATNANTLDGLDSTDIDALYLNESGPEQMTGESTGPALLITNTDGPALEAIITGGEAYSWAVSGWAQSSTGTTRGVSGFAESPQGIGVYGEAPNYGVQGNASSSEGYGVFGYCESGMGVRGNSSTGTGVFGRNDTSGNYGQLGTGDEGVYGQHSNGNYGMLGYYLGGVCGIDPHNNTRGLLGFYDAGVLGINDTNFNTGKLGTRNYGVYGKNGDTGTIGQLGRVDYGVYGFGTSTHTGVHGRNEDSGNFGGLGTYTQGVYGEHADSGNFGALGTDTEGVYGMNPVFRNYGQLGTANEGVYGYAYGVDTYGVYGEGFTGVCGKGNWGVLGHGGRGVYGINDISDNRGVLGYNYAGVYGLSHSVDDYDFYAGGPGFNYGAFTGSHEVKLAAGFPQDFRPGLIISVTGETQVRTDEGEISYSSTLPTVRLADTPDDKTIFGVLISESPLPEDHWYQATEGERFGIVNALGEGRVWVSNLNGDIEAGDYITTSAIAGYGQKQDDDLLHSYTLGKAIETVDWSQVTETIEFNGQPFKIYAIAVVYTSG